MVIVVVMRLLSALTATAPAPGPLYRALRVLGSGFDAALAPGSGVP